jgi:hypothetical protein
MNEQVLTIEAIPAPVYRKLIKIEDPRPWAEKLPYSHALPGEECLNAIGKGDSVTIEVSLHQLSGRLRMKVSPHS